MSGKLCYEESPPLVGRKLCPGLVGRLCPYSGGIFSLPGFPRGVQTRMGVPLINDPMCVALFLFLLDK